MRLRVLRVADVARVDELQPAALDHPSAPQGLVRIGQRALAPVLPGDEGDAQRALDPVLPPVELLDAPGLDRRIVALPMPVRHYSRMLAGPRGTVFVGERVEHEQGVVLHKFTLDSAKAVVFVRGAEQIAVSGDGSKLLFQAGDSWSVVSTDAPPEPGKGTVQVSLSMQLDRLAEWRQMFDEAWRYERDFFYDPGMHGNDWNAVRARYRPLA